MSRRVPLLPLVFLLISSAAWAKQPPSEGFYARSYPMPPVLARAALVMDAATGNVLGSVNPHLRLPMASTTKIMTAIVALRLGNLSDRIKVPAAAFDFEADAAVMGLHPGEVVSFRDLMYGLLLPSGADAANTIAVHYAGSEKKFVAMMNAEAHALGLHDTHFSDTTGLTSKNHYTTAYDLAKLARYATTIPTLMKIAGTRHYHWNGITLTNLNSPLFWYPGVDGIKPGSTDEAGLCQTLDAWRNGRHVIVTILNTPNLDTDARNLLNFGLRDFTWVQSRLPDDIPANTQSGTSPTGSYTYFPASGHSLSGAFLKAFTADGGLRVLGFPRTEPLREGTRKVQYFQNGALAQYPSGAVKRVSLGLTPIPSASATPGTSPTAVKHTPTATLRPTHTPTPRPTATRTAGTKKTPRPTTTAPPKVKKTPTPHPRTTPTPHPKTTPTPSPGAAGQFQAFQQAHPRLLGTPTAAIRHVAGYDLQIFAKGALLFDNSHHVTYMLPLGDRLLSARNFLGHHPGNAYPAGYAPVSILKAIHWFPRTFPYITPTTGKSTATPTA